MLSGRITPAICFDGNCCSTSTLGIFCCLVGALIIPRGYYNSCAYSGYRPKTIGDTSLWASSGVSPDFSRKLFEQTIFRLVHRGAHIVFVLADVRSCRVDAFSLAATPITFGYAIILTTLSGPALRFRATTFMMPGWCRRFYQSGDGRLNIVEARFRLIFKRRARLKTDL